MSEEHVLMKEFYIFMNEKGLPAGSYCNIIDNCASSIQVGYDGSALVTIDNYDEPILAVCIYCG